MPQKTTVKSQGGHFAEISGVVQYVATKKSKGRNLDLTILTMEDGFKVWSWHTSDASRQLCNRAKGQQVTAVAKMVSAKTHTYFNLQHFKSIGGQAVQ